jgi:hypothetical protein
VLRPSGRIVLCEPLMTPLSYPIYKYLHHEPVDMAVDPLAMGSVSRLSEKDPFDSNQAIPTVLFDRDRATFERAYPSLKIISVERLAGLGYLASGGFSRRAVLPDVICRALHRLEQWLPPAIFRLIGFRLLAVIERT